jgi:hypothetical protein
MFPVGATVKNKLNSKIGTVTHQLDDGMIRVRFDGDTGTVPLHHSRFESFGVVVLDTPTAYVDPETFKKGDYVQVTDNNGVVYKGAALNDLGTTGYSVFELLTENGQLLDFNANYVGIVVLFRADIARGQLPNY